VFSFSEDRIICRAGVWGEKWSWFSISIHFMIKVFDPSSPITPNLALESDLFAWSVAILWRVVISSITMLTLIRTHPLPHRSPYSWSFVVASVLEMLPWVAVLCYKLFLAQECPCAECKHATLQFPRGSNTQRLLGRVLGKKKSGVNSKRHKIINA